MPNMDGCSALATDFDEYLKKVSDEEFADEYFEDFDPYEDDMEER